MHPRSRCLEPLDAVKQLRREILSFGFGKLKRIAELGGDGHEHMLPDASWSREQIMVFGVYRRRRFAEDVSVVC